MKKHALLSSLAVQAPLLLAACDSPDEPLETASVEERLRVVAEHHGFDVSQAVFVEADEGSGEDGEDAGPGDYLIVNDDIVFTTAHLDEYEAIIDGDDEQFRGYFRGGTVHPALRDICIVVDNTGGNSALAGWGSNFQNAVNQLNEVTWAHTLEFSYSLQSPNTCPSGTFEIMVREHPDVGYALGEFPVSNGIIRFPGDFILVGNGTVGTHKTALHEIGHNLGFAHPNDSGASRIFLTAAASSNYSSVMWQNGSGPAGNDGLTALSSDDILSYIIKYGD